MKTLRYCFLTLSILIGSNTALAEDVKESFPQEDTICSFQILTDSTTKYDFGYACYFSGRSPKGRIAIDNLTKTKDYATIKRVLNGENNEGIIYAIEALLILNTQNKIELTLNDKNEIKKIIERDLLITRCQGCFVSSIRTLTLFNEKSFKDLLKKNEIKVINNG